MLSQSAFSTAWQAAAATAFIRTVFCSFIMSMIGRLPTALPAAASGMRNRSQVLAENLMKWGNPGGDCNQ